YQAVWEHGGDFDRHVAAKVQFAIGCKVQGLVLRCAAYPLAAGLVLRFYHDFKVLAEMFLVQALLNGSLPFEQDRQTAGLLDIRDSVVETDGRSVRPR